MWRDARARVCVCTEVVIYILTKRNTVDLEPCGRETQRARVMNVRLCQPDLVPTYWSALHQSDLMVLRFRPMRIAICLRGGGRR